MFLFDKHAPDARCGLVIDIGSASVSTAIVVSEVDEPQPTVVWTYTERCAITEEADTVALAKKIAAALLRVSLQISNEGMVALAQHEPKLRITAMQVAVGAPWSYTIPKEVCYQRDEQFTVTTALIRDLIKTAEQETTAAQASGPLFQSLGLEVVSSQTSHFTANGYTVTDPTGQATKELTLVRKVAICQKRLVDTIREIHESIVPKANLEIVSFMEHMQAHVLARTVTGTNYGLIDISGDATEVGIVSEGILKSVTSNALGVYTVAQALAQITQEPVNAAYARLQEFGDGTALCSSAAQQVECDAVLESFVEKTSTLIARARSSADLPTHFLVHSDTGLREFARRMSTRALNELSPRSSTSVAMVSERLVDIAPVPETRLALSVAVFHTQRDG